MRAFIQSQFGYCPLVWMCHDRRSNNTINRVHERALRIVYNDKKSTFEELLLIDDSVTIHHRNLQVLAVELYKVKNELSTELVTELFPFFDNNYNLRSDNCFRPRRAHTVSYGTESLSVLGPKVWDLVPNVIKESSSLNGFKRKIKKWTPTGCPCRLCKVYIHNLGYL